MSIKTQEMDELEAALLPTAELVPPEYGYINDDAIEATEVTVPSEYFSYTNSTSTTRVATTTTANMDNAMFAPAIPAPYGGHNLNNSAREQQLLKQAEYRGRILNDQEQEEIQRNARKIHAINYHQKALLEVANQRARQTQGNEDAGFVQTTLTLDQPEPEYAAAIPKRKAPEFYQGTFGKEYEVAEYTIGEGYETASYDISQYKSVYDS